MRFERFKKKKWCKFICYLVLFAFMLEIPMPAYAASTGNSAVVQSGSEEKEAAAVDDNGTTVKSADTTKTAEETSNITDGSPTSSNDAAETTNNLQNLLNGGMDGDGLNAETILGSANSSTGEDENAALVPTTEKEIITELPELRESNVKYFRNTDGTDTAYVYNHEVHYLADDGTYQDIDNSLKDTETAGGKEILTNEENSADFTLAKDASEGNMVSINKDGYNLKWRLLSAEDSEAKDTTVTTGNLMDTLASTEDPTNVENTIASAQYDDILNNVDVEYVLVGTELKENITLNSAKVPSQLSFVLTTSASLFAKESEGQIAFENADGETVFHMSEAMMYDAKGAESTDITVKLAVISETEDPHQYKLTITPSAAWLKDEARVFPVVLDPTIKTVQTSSMISDTHVNSDYPTSNNATSVSRLVGTMTGGKSSRTFIKFNLPTEIQKSDRIVSATMSLHSNTENVNSIFYDYATSGPTMYMFTPTADWNESTLTWNNKPGYNSAATVDYAKIDIENGAGGTIARRGWYDWDVTSVVDGWYNGAPNYGVMIKDAETTQYAKRVYFHSTNDVDYTDRYPMIAISYVNMIGLEDYWTYHTQSAGLAGNGYVNDFTGGLTATFNDYAWDSEILSLGVSHVYNSDNYNKTQPSLDVGNGYMLSLQESITKVIINGITLYKYVDGDGTQHYFQYSDSKWSDDSGLGLTLIINTDDYTVKDKSDNLRIFYKTTGYLHFIKDNDNNTITLEYSDDGKYLYHAYDGAGHMLSFNQDDNHRLTWISIKETSHRNDAIKQIFYTYDSGNHLTQVKYPGKSTVNSGGSSGSENIAQFGYTAGGSLNSLKDTTNGMRVDYAYADWNASNQRPRVNEFKVYNASNAVESAYTMAYSSHCTRFTETTPNIGRSQVYVFNYMGQTISAQDQDGNALFCETGLAGGAKNKVTFASQAQQSVLNLLTNHDFESGMTSYNSTPETSTCTIDTGNSFYGSNCLKVVKASSSSNIAGKYQSVTVTGGKSYTLSAYIKTSGCSTNGAALRLEALSGSTVLATAETNKIVSEGKYLRFDTTIDLSSLSSSQTYTLNAYLGVTGVAATAYFDAVQLEAGSCANRYNLLENSNLENSTTSWSTDGTTSADLLVSGSGVTRDGKGSCYQFWGDANASKKLYQTITVNGKAGDSYVFGCWVKSSGLVNKDTYLDGTKQSVGMTLKFSNTDGTNTYKNILITPTANEWQYICGEAIAAKPFTTVTVYLKFVFNRNYAWFDDAQLYKDSFGESFTYDSKGNVISVVDMAKNTAAAGVNSTDDTTSYSDGKGQMYNFVYNGDNNVVSTKHNLTQSTAPDGTSSTFVYDSFGNVTQTDQRSSYSGNIATISSSIGYTTNGAYKTSSTDQRNLTTLYTYNEKFGLLTSTSIPVGLLSNPTMLTTTNTYDLDTRKVTEIASSGTNTTLNYGYTQNRPSSIQVGNAAAYLKYGYAYDNAGNMTSVTRSSSGNATPVTLESYGYIAGRGLKGSQTYGNGQTLNYTYDSQDRLIGVASGTKQVGKYIYDGNGLLGKALSYDINGTLFNTTTNQYDLADRLISSANSKGSGIYNVSYDKNNLATGYISYLRDGSANLEYKTTYEYSECLNGTKENGVDKVRDSYIFRNDSLQMSTHYNYDYYGRLTWKKAYIPGTEGLFSPVVVGYGYLSVSADKTTTLPEHMAVRYLYDTGNPDITYYLTYDRSGNITNVNTVSHDGSNYTKTYEYDDLSRLTAATNVANSGDNYAYIYDGRNNITGSTVKNNGATTQTKSYTYATDDIDRLASFSHSTAGGTVTRNYTCDSIGNPTAITETNTATNTTRNVALTWTQGKLLNTVSDNAGLSNTYTYDADGNVAKKVVADGSYVVYHYSDGCLEYEEHFNAAGTLQEVLKYFYDADGNVEYLLYKNDNFSTASAYDLYYYVRNATGDVTDLIQVLAKSTNYNTVVNRLAAHYEYDPYGNILSINKYNNDPIGDINPIRYKDYYYDLQTGWYQLGSRFYDPEVGRFLNADDVSLLMETDSGVVDKNLYAYCDGNPVMRKDDGGDFWVTVGIAVIGAVVGAAFEAASQYAEYGEIKDPKQLFIAAGIGALCAVAPTYAPLITGGGNFLQEMTAKDADLTPSYIANAALDSVVAAGTSKLFGKMSDNIAANIKKTMSIKPKVTLGKTIISGGSNSTKSSGTKYKRGYRSTRLSIYRVLSIWEGGTFYFYKNSKRYIFGH